MASHLDRIVYLNGEFLAGSQATLSIFDRGLLFADAVYEGLGFRNRRVIDLHRHYARLQRSLKALQMPQPLSETELQSIFQQLIDRNHVEEGFLYLHITRGEGERDYVYHDAMQPNIFAFLQPASGHAQPEAGSGLTMRSHADLRWSRRDIKTSNLLGQVIAKTAADRDGDDEALLVDQHQFVTEGGATSFFIVKGDKLFVRPVSRAILHGVTRQAMLQVAEAQELVIVETPFTLEQTYGADEAFITGASTYIEPVVKIDDRPIGTGKPGPITLKLRAAYLKLCDAGSL